MKRPFSSYLKLLHRYLKTDTFSTSDNSSYYPYYGLFVVQSERILIVKSPKGWPVEKAQYSVKYSTGEIRFYEDIISIIFKRFNKENYEFKFKDNFDGKDQFFNYILQNDLEYLRYEDLVLLREIKEMVLGVTHEKQ